MPSRGGSRSRSNEARPYLLPGDEGAAIKFDALKENRGNVIDNLAEGWRHLTRRAAGALTRFRPGEHSGMPAKQQVDDDFYLPGRGWSMLGGITIRVD